MSDTPQAARMDVRPTRQGALRRISLIWLVPLFALGISLAVAYQNYANQGTLIEIIFESASGISEETVIKYRDVDVGQVDKITFTEGLGDVIVSYAGKAVPDMEALAARLPRAELELFEGGHLFFVQDKTAYPRIVEWLSAQDAS